MNTLELRFAKRACDRLTEDSDFGKKIIFSDETHLKNRRTQNESLFSAEFGPEA